MSGLLTIVLPIIGLLFALLVLSQAKGSGLGAAFGGGGEFYASKRGAEKVLFQATVVLSVVFLVLAFFASLDSTAPASSAVPVQINNETLDAAIQEQTGMEVETVGDKKFIKIQTSEGERMVPIEINPETE